MCAPLSSFSCFLKNNKCHTLQWHTRIFKRNKTKSRRWRRRIRNVIYANKWEIHLSSPPVSASFSLASRTLCKLAVKYDRIVKACPFLHVSELHHWTLQHQQELQSEYVVSCCFFFLENISTCPDLILSDYSPAIRGGAEGSLGWQWYLIGPGYHPQFFGCKRMIRMRPLTHVIEPEVQSEIMTLHTYLL